MNRELGLQHLTPEQALWLCQEWSTNGIGVPLLRTHDGFELVVWPINNGSRTTWKGSITDYIRKKIKNIETPVASHWDAKLELLRLKHEHLEMRAETATHTQGPANAI